MSNAAAQGTKAIATRMVSAEENFIASLMVLGGIEKPAAERVLAYYRKHRLVKMDAVGGVINVKHGLYMDSDIIRKAAVL